MAYAFHIRISGLLNTLSETGLLHIKHKLIENQKYFISKNNNPAAAALLKLICESDFINGIDTTLLGTVFEAFTRDEFLEIKKLTHFCQLLTRELKNTQWDKIQDPRAVKYDKYLHESLLAEFYQRIDEKKLGKDISFSSLYYLDDIFKYTACLEAFLKNTESPFSLVLTEKCMNDLEQRVCKPSGTLFENYPPEEQAYFRLLCWILEERLSEQDGLAGEEDE